MKVRSFFTPSMQYTQFWLRTAFFGTALTLFSGAQAQVGSYAFTNGTSAYNTIVGGPGTTPVTLTSVDDAISNPQNIGYTFNFGGTPFTTYRINSNGWLNLGAASTSPTNYTSLSGTENNVIAAFNRDLVGNNTTSTSYYTQLSGATGSRILKVEWVNIRSFAAAILPATGNFQIWLYECTNVIEFRYGAFTTAAARTTAGNVQVGLRGASTAAANVRSLSNTGSWATPTVGTSSASTVAMGTFGVPFLPDNGRLYTWTPTNCVAPVALASVVPDCPNNQFRISVNVSSICSAPSVNVQSNFGGNPGGVTGVGVGTYLLGPFPNNTNVSVTVVHNGSATCNLVISGNSFDCATAGQNALNFDGVNDRVNIPNSASVNITGTALTLEAWIFPTSFRTGSFEGSIINKEQGPGSAGYMLRCGGSGILSFAIGTGTFPEVTSLAGTLVLNTWQHVAGVYNGATLKIYKDGVEVGTANQTAAITSSASTPLQIGNWGQSDSRGFVGLIDEARIWNVARTVPQLNTTLNVLLCGTETGLRAYYQLNQGTAGANNAGVTNAPDLTVNANNGTAQNMALTGPTSNWVVGRTGLGACLNCSQPTATAVVQQSCANNQFFVNVTVSNLNGNPSVNVGSNFGGDPGGQTAVGTGTYLLGPFTSNANVQVSVDPTGFPACNLALGTFTYNCTFFGQNALSCDGTDDRVLVPDAPSLNITGTTITLEAWIFPTAWRTSTFEGGVVVKESGNSGYMLRAGASGTLNFAVSRTSPSAGFNELSSTAGALALNTWQHIAGTYDGTTQRIFINGVQVNSVAISGGNIITTTNQLAIGGWAPDATRCFPGRIDEARVWNVAKTPAEILAGFNVNSCAGSLGLQAYYQFDQGVESANNAGVTTLIDASGNGNNGTLNGFALNGPTSNWVIGRTGLAPCPACNGVPTPGAVTGTSPICANVTTTLSLTGATFASGLAYQWSYGPAGNPTANLLGTLTSQSTAPIPTGIWEVVATVTCPTFASATTAAFPFVKNAVPTATASSNSPTCLGQALNLTGASNIGTAFVWTGPLSFTSSQQSPQVSATATAAMAGTYNLIATANGCSSAATPTVVTIVQAPVLSVPTATPNQICAGGSSQLNVVAAISGYAISNITFASDPAPSGPVVTLSNAGVPTVPLSSGTLDDGGWQDRPIPFSFAFNGISYTSLAISTNGFVRLGAGAPNTYTGYGAAFPAAFAAQPSIGAIYADLDFRGLGTISYYTSGTAPDRRFVISWTNGQYFSQVAGSVASSQLILNEGSNVFEVHTTQNTANVNAVQGAQNVGGTAAWTVTGRNAVLWVVSTPDAYRFTPNSPTYSWTNAGLLNNATIANPIASNVLGTTPFTVTATANGCSVQSSVTLNVDAVPDATITRVQNCPSNQFSLNTTITSTGTGTTAGLS